MFLRVCARSFQTSGSCTRRIICLGGRPLPPDPYVKSTRLFSAIVSPGDCDHGSVVAQDVRENLDRFNDFVARGDALGVRGMYVALANATPTVNLNHLMEKDTLVAAIDVLSRSQGQREINILKSMFAAVQFHLDADGSLQLHHHILNTLLGLGAVNAAFRWLTVEPVYAIPTRDQWHALVATCGERRNTPLVFSVLQTMRQMYCPPQPTTFELFFRAYFKNACITRPRALRKCLLNMAQEGFAHDPVVLDILRDGYKRHGFPLLIKQAEAMYWEVLNPRSHSRAETKDAPSTSEADSEQQPHDARLLPLDPEKTRRMCVISEERGKRAALQMYGGFRKLGFCATTDTLVAVMGESFDTDLLKFWEDSLAVQADAKVWAVLIRNAADKSNAGTALSVYQAALSRGLRPDNAMFHPVIRAVCANGLRAPDDYSIDQALELLEAFVKLHTSDGDEHDQLDESSEGHSTPDAPIYNTVLRAMAFSPNVIEKYVPRILGMLEDMRSRNVSMDSTTSASLIVVLVRSASNHEEAIRIYEFFRSTKDGQSILNEQGYISALHAFCASSKGKNAVPPPRFYFRIVSDMRTAGYEITPPVYTIILRHLADLAGKICSIGDEDELQAQLLPVVNAIRKTHQLLVVDSSLNPDTPLWNQLMDAYQRSGCFAEALRIYEMLSRSSQYNDASLSIILDACGFADAYPTALRVWNNAVAGGVKPNQKNWKTWLECLCRLGHISDAVKAMCLEMSQAEPSVKPDVECAQIVLSFASATNQEYEVRDRIKRNLPSLWKALSSDLRLELHEP